MAYVEGVEIGAVIDSPYDPRDYSINSIMATSSESTLPESYRTPTTVPVLNQGSIGCCVACALASCRYIQEELLEGSSDKFSVNYIYGNRLETDYQGSGMITREALQTILDYGDCPWNVFPGYSLYETASEDYNNNKNHYDGEAMPYKINSYYRVYGKSEIKTAIHELGCVAMSIDVTDNFRYPASDGYVEYDSTQEDGANHVITLIGWTADDHWIVLNSWGDDYGDNGYCYLSFDYPWNEAWTMTDTNRYQKFMGIKKDRCLC